VFHSSTAALTASFKFQDGISSFLYLQALSTEIMEMPTLDRIVAIPESDQVKRAPILSLSGPEVSLVFPYVGCGTGPCALW